MNSRPTRNGLSRLIPLLSVLVFLTGCQAYYPDPAELEEIRDMEDQLESGPEGFTNLDGAPDSEDSR